MRTGDVVTGRFEIEKVAGTGGMGIVYRAKDRHTGEPVALKMLRGDPDEATKGRFLREARVLFELTHPALVRYVAHGATSTGELYLAMEWLEGEDLHVRLRKDGLTLAETLDLGVRVAEGLAFAHREGVIHRDIKPRNLLLVGGDPRRVKILDFGIAHLSVGTMIATMTGVLGTPGYMSPEQARGETRIDGRADLFSLGCVLYHCVAGKAPFSGADMLAVAAKLLLEESPRLEAAAPEVPPEIADLVNRMLSKDPERRPRNADEVVELLQDQPTRVDAKLGAVGRPKQAPALTGDEQRTVCVVVAAPPEGEEGPVSIDDTEGVSVVADATRLYGAQVERLRDGALVAIMNHGGSATDQALSAVRCANVLRERLPTFRFAVALGRGMVTGGLPVGEVIERAAEILRNAPPGELLIDESTSTLVGDHFDLETQTGGTTRPRSYVRGERSATAARRTLLGKKMPCFGRERELRTLDAALHECIDESVARVVLVTGVPGVGKTRLFMEFLAQVAKDLPEVKLFAARADPMSAGSPFRLLAQAVRFGLGLKEAAHAGARAAALRTAIEESVAEDDVQRISAFIGELVGVPSDAKAAHGSHLSVLPPPPGERASVMPPPDGATRASSPPDGVDLALRAARQNPMLMGDQMLRAFDDLLEGVTSQRPVLLVLEDLHWGDLPTVRFVDAVLRTQKDRPLLVVAVARPEVHGLFPQLWSAHALTEIRLSGLSKKASERFVLEALGRDAGTEKVAHIVDRADGNAFFLEELIRAVAEGHDDGSLPETVLGTVEARILELPHEARRVLRAASVFGQQFWRGGTRALLGEVAETLHVSDWLRTLEDRELCVRRPSSRFADEAEYAFRHAIVRDTAYAALTAADRKLGHRLAAEWLEGAGEHDASLLAEHFERAGEPRRAAGFYRMAAEQALEGNDFDAVASRAKRGIDAGADGMDRVWLSVYAAEANQWRGHTETANVAGKEAYALAEPLGGEIFHRAICVHAMSSARLGHVDEVIGLAHALIGLGPDPEAPQAYFEAMAVTSTQLNFAGKLELADALMKHMDAELREVEADPSVMAHVHRARSASALVRTQSDIALEQSIESAKAFDEIGNFREACLQRVNIGSFYTELGALEEGIRALRDARAEAERMGLVAMVANGSSNLGRALYCAGQLDEALTVETEACEMFKAQRAARLESCSRVYLAQILLALSDPAASLVEAERAGEVASAAPERAYALAARSRAEVQLGRIELAVEHATTALTFLDELGGIDEGEIFIRLAFAEALHAGERDVEASAAIKFAHDRLGAQLAPIKNPNLRSSCGARIPENARTALLAHEWLGLQPPV